MRYEQEFIPTLRKAPADIHLSAEALLLRGGYVHRVHRAPHAWLPLGTRLLQRVEGVFLEVLDRGGFCRHRLPAPAGPTEDSALGAADPLFRIARASLRSWKQLPQRWYAAAASPGSPMPGGAGGLPLPPGPARLSPAGHLLVGFEADPGARGASMGSLDTASLQEALAAAFVRLSLPVRHAALPPHGDRGATGHPPGVAWLYEAPWGTVQWLACSACGFAAVEPAVHAPVEQGAEGAPAPERFPTPGVRTIEDLEQPPYSIPAALQLKSLVHVADGEPVLAVVPGDRNISLSKLAHALGAVHVEAATPELVRETLGASPGSLGPVGVTHIPLVVDARLADARGRVTGANVDEHHLRHVDVERDLKGAAFADLCEAVPGDPCPACGTPIAAHRGLPLGWLVPLDPHRLAHPPTALGTTGRPEPVAPFLGHLALDRIVLALADAHRDEYGFRWPAAAAPYDLAVVALDPRREEVTATAEAVFQEAIRAGYRVLLDDRDERAGVKFNDADLVGAPVRITVGRRSLAEGKVEWKLRDRPEKTRVPPHRVLSLLQEVLPRSRDGAESSPASFFDPIA